MRRNVLAIVFAAALSACATGGIYGPDARGAPESDPRAPESDTRPAPAPGAGGEGARLPDAPAPDPSANATAALVAQSREERDTGKLGEAAATIERALTIAPENAGLWMELAEIRMEQGDWEQAEDMARKALTLTAETSDVGVRARRLLAQ
jgi:tetratricopeptide (TPR) repeat protein